VARLPELGEQKRHEFLARWLAIKYLADPSGYPNFLARPRILIRGKVTPEPTFGRAGPETSIAQSGEGGKVLKNVPGEMAGYGVTAPAGSLCAGRLADTR
jgi:hypothetical protein